MDLEPQLQLQEDDQTAVDVVKPVRFAEAVAAVVVKFAVVASSALESAVVVASSALESAAVADDAFAVEM